MNYLSTYHNLGYVIFPLYKSKDKYKHPLIAQWQTLTHDTCLASFEGKNFYNIALIAGITVMILDIDKRKPNEPANEFQDGVEAWTELMTKNNPIDTVIAETTNGGYHYYFVLDDRTRRLFCGNKQWIYPNGLRLTWDVKNNTIKGKIGGYVLVPPSYNPNTRTSYRWAEGFEPWTINPASMPDWLYNFLINNRIKDNLDDLTISTPKITNINNRFTSTRIISENIIKIVENNLKLKFGDKLSINKIDSPWIILKNHGGYYCPDCNRIHDNMNPMIHVNWRNQTRFECGCKAH